MEAQAKLFPFLTLKPVCYCNNYIKELSQMRSVDGLLRFASTFYLHFFVIFVRPFSFQKFRNI